MNIMTVFLPLVICALFCAIGYLLKDNDHIKRENDYLKEKNQVLEGKTKLPSPISDEDAEKIKKAKKELENFYSYDGTRQG